MNGMYDMLDEIHSKRSPQLISTSMLLECLRPQKNAGNVAIFSHFLHLAADLNSVKKVFLTLNGQQPP
jgi:hypothetical protein